MLQSTNAFLSCVPGQDGGSRKCFVQTLLIFLLLLSKTGELTGVRAHADGDRQGLMGSRKVLIRGTGVDEGCRQVLIEDRKMLTVGQAVMSYFMKPHKVTHSK